MRTCCWCAQFYECVRVCGAIAMLVAQTNSGNKIFHADSERDAHFTPLQFSWGLLVVVFFFFTGASVVIR